MQCKPLLHACVCDCCVTVCRWAGLQDKAENDLLARSVPRTLNLGLLAASIGHLLVLGPILNQVGGTPAA